MYDNIGIKVYFTNNLLSLQKILYTILKDLKEYDG